MPKGIKGFKKGHRHSEETKKKIGDALRKQISYFCDYCGKEKSDRPSHYKKKKRHFCCRGCYSGFRKWLLPKEEQPRYGSGLVIAERRLRKKCRSDLNHAVRDGKIKKGNCVMCNEPAQSHHSDYSKPLKVVWLCFKHHRQIHTTPKLLEKP